MAHRPWDFLVHYCRFKSFKRHTCSHDATGWTHKTTGANGDMLEEGVGTVQAANGQYSTHFGHKNNGMCFRYKGQTSGYQNKDSCQLLKLLKWHFGNIASQTNLLFAEFHNYWVKACECWILAVTVSMDPLTQSRAGEGVDCFWQAIRSLTKHMQ